MTAAIATQPDDQSLMPAPYLPLSEVVERLGCTPRWAQRLCDEQWGPDGLARKFNGVWGVHPRADQRLVVDRDLAQRDREQIAELEQQRVKPAAIDRARSLRDIIRGLADFECDARTPRQLRQFYIAHLLATGALQAEGIRKLSVTTLYQWERRYREGGIRALVRKGGAVSADDETGRAAMEYIFNLVNCGNRISLATAITIARGQAQKHKGDAAWRIGSYSAVRIAINDRTPNILKVLAGKGERQAKADCIPKGHRDFESMPSNEEWVGDERTLDVMCRVLTARGWAASRKVQITAWMDMRSRVITGWVLKTFADSNTILGSFKLGVIRWGKPRRLRVDWGHDYKKATGSPHSRRWKVRSFDGQRIGSVLDELGIEVSPVMPYTPWSKPIESFFKTMKEHLDRMFASFWGGCPSERHEDRQRWVRDHLEQLPTTEDVAQAIAAFLDAYHRTPHGAVDLFGKSPLEAMEAFRDGAARMESDQVLAHLFREFVGPKLVRRDGIRHNRYWYGHGDSRIVSMQGQRVLLAVQPDDAGHAMVCKLDRTPLFECECAPLRGFTPRDAADLAKQQARMMRPFKQQAAAARRFFRGTTPAELLANQAAGVRAKHGNREPTEVAPTALTIRPALQAALDNAGPAPDEQASRAVRTGTDDDISFTQLLAEDGVDVAPAHEEGRDEAPIDFFGLDDPGGAP